MFSMAKIMVEEKAEAINTLIIKTLPRLIIVCFFHHNLFVFHEREYLSYTLKLLQTEPSTSLILMNS